jgi:hypothetical protein
MTWVDLAQMHGLIQNFATALEQSQIDDLEGRMEYQGCQRPKRIAASPGLPD